MSKQVRSFVQIAPPAAGIGSRVWVLMYAALLGLPSDLPAQVWNSWDIATQAGSPQAVVSSTVGGVVANVEFYESTNNGGVLKATLFGVFNLGAHTDAANGVERFWSTATGVNAYPYAGKSNVNRGAGVGETSAPSPLGVRDLQMHSPENSHLTVAAFRVPIAGTYTVSNLGVRRVVANSGTARLKFFSPQQSLLANLQATANRAWVTTTSTYNLGALTAGQYIYFGVDPDGSDVWDATEVAWTITANGAPPPAPTLTFTASPANINAGGAATLAWTSANATSCTAAGAWSGAKSLSGSQSVTPAASAAYSLSCVGSGGTVTQQVTVTVAPPPTGALHYFILSTGQSLSVGYDSDPPLSTTQPYGNLMFNPGVEGTVTPLIPLRESGAGESGNVETPSSGMANSLSAYLMTPTPFLVGLHGHTGTTYSGLAKGSSYYARGITQVANARSYVQSVLGGSFRAIGVTVVHGENDYFAGNAGAYAGYLAQWQTDYQNDVNAITGSSVVLPLFTNQMNSALTGELAVAQLNAHRNNPGRVILVGPKYQFPYQDDNLHLTNVDSKFMGEMFAKVMNRVVFRRETWNPLMPTSVSRQANVITVSYHIPVGPLAIDTVTLAARPNLGFEFVQTGGNSVSISAVDLVNSNTQVRITLSATPTGTAQRLRYAWTCPGGHSSAGYPRCGGGLDPTRVGGNLRDSDTSVSPAPGSTVRPLYNFSVTFDEPVTAVASAPVINSFTATPATIGPGQGALLSWSVGGATSVSINPGIGVVTGSSVTVTPATTTTYTLTATNASGSSTAAVTVTVSSGPPPAALEWNSWDTATQAGSPQATVRSVASAVSAVVEFYESANAGGVVKGSLFSTFTAASHVDLANSLEQFWSTGTGIDAYPYAGKSTVNRGAGAGETGAPAPLGVRDMQLHPPESSRLTVAAFRAPVAGTYSVANLGVRRVVANAGTARLKLFNAQQILLANLQATNNRAWVSSPVVYTLGRLNAGELIYFGVDADGSDVWDATEVAWKVRCLPD